MGKIISISISTSGIKRNSGPKGIGKMRVGSTFKIK